MPKKEKNQKKETYIALLLNTLCIFVEELFGSAEETSLTKVH